MLQRPLENVTEWILRSGEVKNAREVGCPHNRLQRRLDRATSPAAAEIVGQDGCEPGR
jgi:hypothetical protein